MTGTGHLIRLILRRDRLLLPLWVILLALVPVGYLSSFNGLFPTAAARQQYYDLSVHNAGFVALYGRLSGPTIGELVSWRAGFLPVIVALFSLLTVVRHTRTDEEAGRTELIGAAAIGRHAQLGAALIVTFAANLLLAVLLAGALAAQGLPPAGSAAMGAQFALAGWSFAAVAAITAQLTAGARGARSIAILALGAVWVLRLAGDVSAVGTGALSWLSWLSPIGWLQHIQPYGGNIWWPVAPALACTAAATALAGWLLSRRDLGDGLFPARPGPATASPRLRSPLALAWRLHRALLVGWTVAFLALGTVFGAVAASVADLAADNTAMTDIFARLGGTTAITNAYFATVSALLGLIATGYALQATLRLREEETTGHAEALLTTAVPRLTWAASHLTFALLGPAAALTAAALAEGTTHGDTGTLLTANLSQLPAIWVLTAIALLLFGLLPRAAAGAWAALALCVLILMVGQTMKMSHWLLDISPFTHIPHLPGNPLTATPLITLTLTAIALTAAGLTALNRRDIQA